MNHIKFHHLLFLIAAMFFLGACTKMNDYEKYTVGGPLKYAGRVDTVIVHPGNNRMLLTMVLGSDPSVKKIKTYWNNGMDSLETPVNRTSSGKDTIDIMINDMPPNIYNFSVYTYDDKGRSSVVTNASGSTYGDNYFPTISNRELKSLVQADEGGKVMLNWADASVGDAGTELVYANEEGAVQKVVVPPSENVTELTGYKENSVLKYRSVYLPEPAAFDTFSTGYSSVTLPVFERKLDKSLFEALKLPTDIGDGGYGWHIEFLWDENYGTPGWATQVSMPQWYTLDLGVKTTLSSMKEWQAPDRLYSQQDVKRFEVWGSNDPAADGSWDSWTKLLTCESIKPSGLPTGQTSEEDVAYATAGERFVFPEGTPAVRYIRIKVLETWGEDNWSTTSELTFWTGEH